MLTIEYRLLTLHQNRLFPLLSHPDQHEFRSRQSADFVQIILCTSRQVGNSTRIGSRLFPTRHFDVDRPATIELPNTGGREFNLLPVQFVADTDLERFQSIQAIEICDRQLIDSVYNCRKSSSNRIEPAAAPSPSGDGTEFAAHPVQ